MVFYTVLAAFIAFVTLEGRFPISGLDYAYFFGPILEIACGKTIYTDIPVQHGFLPTLLFTFLYKIHFLQLDQLSIVVWIMYVIQYFLSFYLIFKVSRSVGFSLLGMFSVITLNYFSLSHLPASLPQIGPMRWLPSVIVLVLLLNYKKVDAKLLIFAVGLFSLGIIDAGIALVLGYLLSLFIFFLARDISFNRILKSFISLVVNVVLIVGLVISINLMLGYKMIDLGAAFHSLSKYASLGIAQMPIDTHTYFWVVVMIFLASIVYYFKQDKHDATDQLIVFAANFSLLDSIYYLGRAHPHNLFNISSIPTLTLFLLVAKVFGDIKSMKIRSFILISLFCLTIIYPSVMRQYTMTEMIITQYQRLTGGQIFKPEIDEIIKNRYAEEAKLIKQQLSQQQIAILSNDDTYLFYLVQKNNLIDANPSNGIDTISDLNHAVRNAIIVCPKKIAADCSLFNRCSPTVGIDNSGFDASPFLLAKIEEACKIKYEPTKCTSQLCIAEGKR